MKGGGESKVRLTSWLQEMPPKKSYNATPNISKCQPASRRSASMRSTSLCSSSLLRAACSSAACTSQCQAWNTSPDLDSRLAHSYFLVTWLACSLIEGFEGKELVSGGCRGQSIMGIGVNQVPSRKRVVASHSFNSNPVTTSPLKVDWPFSERIALKRP